MPIRTFTRSPGSAAHTYEDLNFVDPRTYGVTGDGVTDDAPAWQTLIDAAPNGSIVYIDDPTWVMLLGSTVTLTDKRDIIISTFRDARNAGEAPQFKWNGSNNGVMFDLERCQASHIEGFYWTTAAGKTVDTAVNIDGYTSGNISTLINVRRNLFNFTNQLNSAAKIVSISATAISNNENMTVEDNDIAVSSAQNPAAGGYGIYVGPSANAKHHRFYRNTISGATVGIYVSNGSCEVSHLGGGFNKTDIYVANSTEPITVRYLQTEGSVRAIEYLTQSQCLILESCRFANANQTNTGGYVKVDGVTTVRGCNFENPPPVGGTLFEDANTGNLSLTVQDCRFTNGTTYANSGLKVFQDYVDAGLGGRSLLAWNNLNITGQPSRYYYQFNGLDVVTADPMGHFFGTPIKLRPVTFAQLTAAPQAPTLGQMACVSNSNTIVWGAVIAGGGANGVLAFFNGTNWTVAGA